MRTNTNYFTSSQLKRFLIEARFTFPSLRMYAARLSQDKWAIGLYARETSQCITVIRHQREWKHFLTVCRNMSRSSAQDKHSLFRSLPVHILLSVLDFEAQESPEASQESQPEEKPDSWQKAERFIVEKLAVFTAAACVTVGLPTLLNAPLPVAIGGLLLAGLLSFKGKEIYDLVSDQIDPSTKRIILKISMALGDWVYGLISAGCIIFTLIFFILIYLYPAEMWYLLKLVKK